MPHPVWERHLHKCEKEREVRMTKAEKDSKIITTICEYENSVAMPDNERLTYLDACGIVRLKDGNGNVKAQEAYANRCSEYLRFGQEVDLAACGTYSPYDALKVCDTPEIFLKTGFEQRPMLYTQKHLFQALTPKSDYNPHRHGFSIEQVKRFPELLASPVVLANSPTREDVLLAILLATDAYDTPLIAGIKPDGTGNYGEREVETNMVLSVYSRQNFIRYFALLRDMDAFVFVSGRKIEALEDLSGLPLAENCSGLDIDRILQRQKSLGYIRRPLTIIGWIGDINLRPLNEAERRKPYEQISHRGEADARPRYRPRHHGKRGVRKRPPSHLWKRLHGLCLRRPPFGTGETGCHRPKMGNALEP